MYFNRLVAGADHALCGMIAFGSTQTDGSVQPGV